MIEACQRVVEPLEVVFKRVLRVDKKRRAKLFDERFHRYSLAVKFATDITKIVHRGILGPNGG